MEGGRGGMNRVIELAVLSLSQLRAVATEGGGRRGGGRIMMESPKK